MSKKISFQIIQNKQKAAEKTKPPAKITSKITPKPKKKPVITDPLVENPQGKRFEQKHLLDNDTELGEYAYLLFTLR